MQFIFVQSPTLIHRLHARCPVQLRHWMVRRLMGAASGRQRGNGCDLIDGGSLRNGRRCPAKGDEVEALRPPRKNKTWPVFVFPVVALLPGPTRGAGRVGWVGVRGRGSRPLTLPCPAPLCSARWVTDPSVFVYPGLNVTRQLGPLIQHLCHHNMCHYLGAGHHFTSPLIWGVGGGALGKKCD